MQDPLGFDLTLGEYAKHEFTVAVGVERARYDDVVAGRYAKSLGHLATIDVATRCAHTIHLMCVELETGRFRLVHVYIVANLCRKYTPSLIV